MTDDLTEIVDTMPVYELRYNPHTRRYRIWKIQPPGSLIENRWISKSCDYGYGDPWETRFLFRVMWRVDRLRAQDNAWRVVKDNHWVKV